MSKDRAGNTRMTDEQLSSWFNQTPEDVYAEARRARAAETTLAAQLAASQAECERLRSERDAALEALAPFARYPGDYQFRRDPDETVIWRHDIGPVLTVGDWRKARAALSPPAPKGEAQAKETP